MNRANAGAALLVALCAQAAHAAKTPWMNDAEISAKFDGKTIDGRYASGKNFTETYRSNGRVEYVEPSRVTGGRWSVTAGTLCTIYDFDAAGGCFRVAQVGGNCFEFYFASRAEEAAPGPEGSQPRWTARGSINGEADACPDGANV